MSEANDDVEINQEEEKTTSSVFTLKIFLIVSFTLISLCVVLVLLGSFGNARAGNLQNSSSRSNPTPSAKDLFIFQRYGKVFSLNPSDRRLKSKYLFFNGHFSHIDNVQLTMDKKRLYFFDDFSCLYDFNSKKVSLTGLPLKFRDMRFLLKKTDPNSYFFGALSESETCIIRQNSIDPDVTIKDYPSNCLKSNLPEILAQTPDGENLLYRCYKSSDYYLKTLNDSNSKDRFLFSLLKSESLYDTFFSPDGSKLLFHDRSKNYWNLVDLKVKYISFKMKQIHFTMDARSFKYLALSDDMSTLYFVVKSNEEYKLHEINYKSLFEGDYSTPQSAFDIGEGRTIEFDLED